MLQLLLAIDPQIELIPGLDFARNLAQQCGSGLTGIFLENYPGREIAEPGLSQFEEISLVERERNKLTDENIRQFRETCAHDRISARIHRDRGVPLEEAIAETRFADLLILAAETGFEEREHTTPSRFQRMLLEKAECPVILVHDNADQIQEIVLAYDGSASCMHAIKQFTYLFPDYHNIKLTILEVRKQEGGSPAGSRGIHEWVKSHYESTQWVFLQGDPAEELFRYLFGRTGLILVTGAFGRSPMSTLIRKSRTRMVVKTAVFPIFFAHG